MAEFVVIAGMSGAGRSTAAGALEDLGWFVIDNLPPSLFGRVGELVNTSPDESQRIALVLGRGGSDSVGQAAEALDELQRAHHVVRVIFLDAPDEVLIRRYEGTRRRHPEGNETVEQAITAERARVKPLRDRADMVVETGELNAAQLKARISEAFAQEQVASRIRLSIVTFGFKNGLPLDADLLFDLRFLPNPYWDEELRPLTGLDEAIASYVLAREEATYFVDTVAELITRLLPSYVHEGKTYLTVALGCTGGRHRSVAVAEALAAKLEGAGATSAVFHRDIERP